VHAHVQIEFCGRNESFFAIVTRMLFVIQMIHSDVVAPRSVHIKDTTTIFALIFRFFAINWMLMIHMMVEANLEFELVAAHSAGKTFTRRTSVPSKSPVAVHISVGFEVLSHS
jgi:hypothetical protein